MPDSVELTAAYRAVMAATSPVVTRWGRLDVTGLECVPVSGPTLILCNHDSYWDPIAVGMAARHRRQIRALAKASLWKNPLVGRVLDGMGQIPLQRGAGDAAALDAAIAELKAGACIGVFPEGTISRGQALRARSGAGRLALAVPHTVIVCAAVRGTVDVIRFPTRPNISVQFFLPAEPAPRPNESAGEVMARLMAEIRTLAPPVTAGRSRPPRSSRAD
jgi:1-acyl-sn-glycerol-3-phosphate acyltransferase